MDQLKFGYYRLLLSIFSEDEMEVFHEKSIQPGIDKLLTDLTPRRQKVLKTRFGLLDGKIKTLQEIGSDLGVCRERVRQIERKSIRLLRHKARRKYLKEIIKVKGGAL